MRLKATTSPTSFGVIRDFFWGHLDWRFDLPFARLFCTYVGIECPKQCSTDFGLVYPKFYLWWNR
jgi:hypothetical protein